MGLGQFDTIDIVTADPNGRERWITVAAAWPEVDDALTIVQFLVKFARLRRHAADHPVPVIFTLISFAEPPACVVEIAAREGIDCQVGRDHALARGRPSIYGNGPGGWPDIDALMQANARAFAEAHALPWPPDADGLLALDLHLAGLRADDGLADDESATGPVDGDVVVRAGAYAGEAIRRDVGGAWRLDAAALMNPVHLAAGPAAATAVNPLGKVGKFLREGTGESLAFFAVAVADVVRGKR